MSRDISSSNRQPETTVQNLNTCSRRQLLFLEYISPSADVIRLQKPPIKHPYTIAVHSKIIFFPIKKFHNLKTLETSHFNAHILLPVCTVFGRPNYRLLANFNMHLMETESKGVDSTIRIVQLWTSDDYCLFSNCTPKSGGKKTTLK